MIQVSISISFSRKITLYITEREGERGKKRCIIQSKSRFGDNITLEARLDFRNPELPFPPFPSDTINQ